MIREYTKNGRVFVMSTERKIVFVGTEPVFSNFAAQLLVRDLMKTTGWKSSGTFRLLRGTTAVGYKIPLFTSSKKAETILANLFD